MCQTPSWVPMFLSSYICSFFFLCSVKRWQQANHRLALATKILSAFAPGPTTATDASRQTGAAPGPYRTFKDSPKSRQRAQTTFHTHQRPKTAYFDDTDPTADTSTGKLVKVKKKSRVERSTTFRKEKEKEKEKEKGKGNEGGDGARGVSEQQVCFMTHSRVNIHLNSET